MKRRIQGSSPSLWKTDENWPHQAVPKTWSHVSLKGRFRLLSCAMCLWHSSIFPEELSICWGRRAGSKQDFAVTEFSSCINRWWMEEEGEGRVVKDVSLTAGVLQ